MIIVLKCMQRDIHLNSLFFMASRNSIIFDENLYPIVWHFNSDDCSLSDKEKKEIFFIMSEESKKLWDLLFPFNNLMDIGRDSFFLKEKKNLILMMRMRL